MKEVLNCYIRINQGLQSYLNGRMVAYTTYLSRAFFELVARETN